jgi:hypothetical protein
LNLISILIGLVALVIVLVGLFPLLGWLNWFALPIAVIGLVVGMFARNNQGRNLNIALLVIAIVRLALGGGVF